MSSRKRSRSDYHEDSPERQSKKRKYRETPPRSRRDRDENERENDDRHHRRSRRDDYYRDEERYHEKDRYRRRSRDRSSSKYSKEDKYRSERSSSRSHHSEKGSTSRHEKEKPASKLGLNIGDLAAKLAAAKESLSQAKAELEAKTDIPTTTGLSEEAKYAIRIAEAKLESKPVLPALGSFNAADTNEKLFKMGQVHNKTSILNRRLERKKLEADMAPVPVESVKFFDPRIAPKKVDREKRTFNFVTPGTYVRQGQSMRAEIFTTQTDFDESDPLNKRLFTQLRRDPVPPVEWWDRFLMPTDQYDLDSIKLEKITLYVEHPVPEKLPEKDKRDIATSFLTKKEKKKLRRIHREEVQKEKQIKVMLGLEKPPEARATLSNMTRVYGSKAYEDPTKIEQMVRQQMQERLDKHLTQNLERKLTPEQRKQKKLEKLRKNETGEIEVVVYKIKDVSHPLHRKNIDHTARDGAISGVFVICSDCNVVVAEGGPRAIKKFKRLMDKRLQWQENNPENSCDLVWEGILKKRQFKKFRFHECSSQEAREIFESRNAIHYWETALAFSADLAE